MDTTKGITVEYVTDYKYVMLFLSLIVVSAMWLFAEPIKTKVTEWKA